MKWKYVITSSNDASNSFAYRTGWGNRIPLIGRVVREGKESNITPSSSFFNLDIPNLLLVSSKPSDDGSGIILHLRETDGGHATVDIAGLIKQAGADSAIEVSVLEEEISQLGATMRFGHYESRFIKLSF